MIDRYTIKQSLGKGGMGEVFLAYDPVCKREVALKRIKPELKEKKSIQVRFLREAQIASQLTHPSIVPIFTINEELFYYTMPYVEGETLRQVLKETKEGQKRGKILPPVGGSVASLLRIFLQICEAISYAHSKKIIHRDLKPENIIIGKYGEVMILDWGIAEFLEESVSRRGKVAGTISYMAPERVMGNPSSIRTEIYALGIILYQILTLELPFHRGNLAAFRKVAGKEKWISPIELAPYREIPQEIEAILQKCLANEEEKRFAFVSDLIEEIKKVVEGQSSWVFAAELKIEKKEDWEFQENVFLAKHIAITRHVEFMEWVSLMVSQQMFPGNIRIETKVKIKEKGGGAGFLLSIPELSQRKSLEQGYCLWLGPQGCQLFRCNVLVAETEVPFLQKGKWHQICLEKTVSFVKVFLDEVPLISYSSHFPLSGTHIGMLHKDAEFEIKPLRVYTSSYNAMINCLAVPDAFYAYKDYEHALLEYRKIGRSFPGREEGREAFFRAGLTLLQKAKEEQVRKEKKQLFHQALEEFEHLTAAGAPLQLLGKAMVYEALEDYEEEVKCLEFALRKYPKHPLLSLFEEYILFRMHESSHTKRQAAYHLILLAVRYFPKIFHQRDTKNLLEGLKKHWEFPFFMEEAPKESLQARIAIILAFWVRNRAILVEISQVFSKMKEIEEKTIQNALMGLFELDFVEELEELMQEKTVQNNLPWGLKELLLGNLPGVISLLEKQGPKLDRKQIRILYFLLKEKLLKSQFEEVQKFFSLLPSFEVSKEDLSYLDEMLLWALLAQGKRKAAKNLVKRYSEKMLSSAFTPLHTAYGCFLSLEESEEKATLHFTTLQEKRYPPLHALASAYLCGKIEEEKGWIKSAFYYEKKILFERLILFFYCTKEKEKETFFRKRLECLKRVP